MATTKRSNKTSKPSRTAKSKTRAVTAKKTAKPAARSKPKTMAAGARAQD